MILVVSSLAPQRQSSGSFAVYGKRCKDTHFFWLHNHLSCTLWGVGIFRGALLIVNQYVMTGFIFSSDIANIS